MEDSRLHESLGDRPPAEVEAEWKAVENDLEDGALPARTAPGAVADERLAAGLPA